MPTASLCSSVCLVQSRITETPRPAATPTCARRTISTDDQYHLFNLLEPRDFAHLRAIGRYPEPTSRPLDQYSGYCTSCYHTTVFLSSRRVADSSYDCNIGLPSDDLHLPQWPRPRFWCSQKAPSETDMAFQRPDPHRLGGMSSWRCSPACRA